MDLGKPIAKGRTATIYPWKDGQVIKVFHDWMSTGSIEYESRVARAVHEAGLPVPAPGDVIDLNGRTGLVYERIDGVSLLEVLAKKPWRLLHYARLLAKLQADLHKCAVPEIPSLKQRLEGKILSTHVLTSGIKEKVLGKLYNMPDAGNLCHGDFHPGNILMTAKGPIIIDWMDATKGNPLADVSRTSVLFRTADIPDWMPARRLIRLTRGWFHRIYLNHYFQLNPGNKQSLPAWLIINAAARLAENIEEEQDRLVAIVTSGLTGKV